MKYRFLLGRGFAWLDTGAPGSRLEAAEFVSTIERRQGMRIAGPEEIAWRMESIDDTNLARSAARITKSDYAIYLASVLE